MKLKKDKNAEIEAIINQDNEAADSSEKKAEKFKKEAKSGKVGATRGERLRHLKYGSLSVVFTVVVIAVIVLCNVLVSFAAEKFPALSFDTSANQYYELTDESIEFLDTLDDYSIKVRFIGSKSTLMSDDYYSKITTLAEKYEQYTPDLTVSYVDIDKNPGFAADYDDAQLTTGDALVVCGDRYRQLTSGDFLYSSKEDQEAAQNSGGTEEVEYSLNAEYALTTAIMVVTASDNPQATVVTGHGEKELPKLVKLLENNGFTVSSQNIIKEFADDSNLLIIAAPTKDYSESELKKLDDFMYNNGKYGKNIFYIADYSQPVLPNLEAFLYDWGIILEEGVVYESDDSVAIASRPYLTRLSFIDPNLTLSSALADVTAYGYYGRPAKIADVLDVSMTNEITLQHTETSKVGKATEDGFEKGDGEAYPYVAMARTTIEKTDADYTAMQSSLIFANSLGFFEDELFEKAYSANPDVTIAVVDAVLGRGNNLLIPIKSLSAATLGITYETANIIGAVAAIVIPVLLLVACLFVYIRRRFL